jgi:hypothetical protein
MRAGISSLRSSRRNVLTCSTPEIFGPFGLILLDPRLTGALGQIAHAAHIAGALLHGDHAARLQQVEEMRGLDRLIIGGQRNIGLDAALRLGLGGGKAANSASVSATSKLYFDISCSFFRNTSP